MEWLRAKARVCVERYGLVFLLSSLKVKYHLRNKKDSNGCRCSRTLLLDVRIESAHCDCERNLCMGWGGLKMCSKCS